MLRSIRIAAATAMLFTTAAHAQELPAPADLPPALPDGASPSFVPPARDAQGAYQTPNRDLSPDEVTWHVRVALNVAALGCRDRQAAATVAGYNALLTQAKAPLAVAAAGSDARYKARYAGAWQARQDDDMTRLYNFFAQPPAHDAFCAAAEDALQQAATVAPADFPAFAAATLPKLEAPFLAFFERYDDYRVALAGWTARHAPAPVPQVVIATSAPAPVLAALTTPASLTHP